MNKIAIKAQLYGAVLAALLCGISVGAKSPIFAAGLAVIATTLAWSYIQASEERSA